MADKITNFEDYKKKSVEEPVEKVEKTEPVKEKTETPVKKEEPVKKPDLSETTVINGIEIEDPYNFFTEEEREAYFRERQKAESGNKQLGKETVKDERRESVPKKDPEKPIRPRRERSRRDYYEDDVREDDRYEDDIRRRDYDYYEEDDYDRDYEDDYDDEEYDESEDKMMRIVVRIASIMTGIVILTLVCVVLKTSVFDRLLHKDPEEQVTEETQENPEGAAEEPKTFEIPAGYNQVDDTVTVITNDLNLRNKPKNEEGSEVVAVAKVGTQLKRVAVDGGGYWAIVEYEGQYLYASMNYLTTP
ncbi:SH3 domain-containing protein [Butyrivibrio sp. X503]|uniref:SH3 domain-containing protein n=1 Tax=Butyrivibrio sp. X503 TaxID=2364878 RepID=UPI000EAA857A|nr:SH3 domain-containing protein [Butyrivibrio sp. X503]RKM54897.1 SH3 domain-containing protein [Butyrivibrio sp. X503]